MSQQLVPILAGAFVWLLMFCNDRSQRTTVGALCALGTVIAVATAMRSIEDRAGVFGPDLPVWGLHIVVVVVLFAAIAHLARSVPGPWLSSTLGLGLFWLVVPFVASEVWFGLEEFVFRRDVLSSGASFHVQPRGAPFTGNAMVYSNGRYSAQ